LELSFKKALQGVKRGMRNGSLKAVASIKTRIQETGTDANGKKFTGSGPDGGYSPQYKEERQKARRRVDIINLSFSGRMLNNLKPIKQSPDGGQVIIGFSSAEEKKKASNVTEVIGPFLDLSEKEQEAVRKSVSKQVIALADSVNKTFTIK